MPVQSAQKEEERWEEDGQEEACRDDEGGDGEVGRQVVEARGQHGVDGRWQKEQITSVPCVTGSSTKR